jgi:hypothetical protein
MATLAPPPADTPIAQGDGKATPTWARWFSQFWDALRGENWVPMALENGWVDFDATSKQTAAYRKNLLGRVYFKGLIKSGTIGLRATSLPAGYRPALRAHFPTVSNDAFGYFYVDQSGDVYPLVGSNVYFSLDVGAFRAEN